MEYSVIQDTEKAESLLHNLMDSCPGDELVGEAMPMLADIHEIDLRDLEQRIGIILQVGQDYDRSSRYLRFHKIR